MYFTSILFQQLGMHACMAHCIWAPLAAAAMSCTLPCSSMQAVHVPCMHGMCHAGCACACMLCTCHACRARAMKLQRLIPVPCTCRGSYMQKEPRVFRCALIATGLLVQPNRCPAAERPFGMSKCSAAVRPQGCCSGSVGGFCVHAAAVLAECASMSAQFAKAARRCCDAS